jgi:ABC-type Na+ transport system ATPase subunit NatA
MVISNQIFEAFRSKQKEIEAAQKLLEENNFIVFQTPLKGELFHSNKIKDRVKQQTQCIKLLLRQGYTIKDLEGNWLIKGDYESNREEHSD